MKYFDINFLDFFKELAPNNNKIWFDLHRNEYEKFVKTPFAIFIQDLIDELKKLDVAVSPYAKDVIFRINRDIRFAKDKTPYKLFSSALLSATGRKDISNPGFYIEMDPEKLAIFGGMYMPDATQIMKIRTHIAQNLKEFSNIISTPDFVQKFEEIKGEKQKRIPKEMKEEAEKQNLLYNKQWYIVAQVAPETILQEDLMQIVLSHIKTALPLHNFIKTALSH